MKKYKFRFYQTMIAVNVYEANELLNRSTQHGLTTTITIILMTIIAIVCIYGMYRIATKK